MVHISLNGALNWHYSHSGAAINTWLWFIHTITPLCSHSMTAFIRYRFYITQVETVSSMVVYSVQRRVKRSDNNHNNTSTPPLCLLPDTKSMTAVLSRNQYIQAARLFLTLQLDPGDVSLCTCVCACLINVFSMCVCTSVCVFCVCVRRGTVSHSFSLLW